ncbi:MAG: helix-turn-helix domain-containing protein [Chitinophagales bacterium]|nr:helix-turn-helix domain-containing protein [Chitinophagales bacterium]
MYIFIFLLIVASFLLISFSLHLFLTKKGSRVLNFLLGFSFLSRFFQTIVFLILIASFTVLFPIVQEIYILLYFGSLASSYLYVRCFVNGEDTLTKKDFIHLIPILFAVLHLFPFLFFEKTNWKLIAEQILIGGQLSITEQMGLFSARFYNIAQIIFSAGYLLASWWVIYKSKFFERQWDNSKKWLLFFISMSSFFKILSYFAMIYGTVERSYTNSIVLLSLSCAVLLFMLLFVIYQPQILYGYLVLSDSYLPIDNELKKQSPIKVSVSDEHKDCLNILEKYVESSQAFLEQEFQMRDLSFAVNISTNQCSEAINLVLGKSFRDWINAYRVRYFIEQYPQQKDNMTVESVAFQSGFKNMRTFYNAFKKETNQNPKSYFNSSEEEL